MIVLSLFDGISCAYEALRRANIPIKQYYASEIEKNAIQISKKNHPDIVQLGDVKSIVGKDLPQIDLLIGGSPCQDLSIAKHNRQGLEGNRSSLFWEYARLLKECDPKYFILENVASMPKEARQIITETIGIEPLMFDASLVSAQSRKRLFWTNIKFELPEDRGIILKDILLPETEVDERFVIKNKQIVPVDKQNEHFNQVGYFGVPTKNNVGGQALRVYDINKKSTTSGVGLYVTGAAIRGNTRTETPEGIVYSDKLDIRKDEKANALTPSFAPKLSLVSIDNNIRRLTPIECERLQGLPDNYTEGVALTNRYKVLGNAFNVDVVAHILFSITNIDDQSY